MSCKNQCSSIEGPMAPTCCRTYCSGCRNKLATFLLKNAPSTLTMKRSSIIVNNRQLRNRQGIVNNYNRKAVSLATLKYVRENLCTLTNQTLVNLALKEDIVDGFWKITCPDIHTLDLYWTAFVVDLYKSSLDYKYILCQRLFDTESSIFIINDDFRNLQQVMKIGRFVQNVAASYKFDLETKFYYSPAFYSDVGISGDTMAKNAPVNTYIYSYSFDPKQSNINCIVCVPQLVQFAITRDGLYELIE